MPIIKREIRVDPDKVTTIEEEKLNREKRHTIFGNEARF
jgi:hypothetical protein